MDSLKDFVIGNNTNKCVSENQNSEEQAGDRHRCFERIVDTASQNQVKANNTDDKIRDAVDSAVIAIENLMLEAILTALNDIVFPWAAMAVDRLQVHQETDLRVKSKTLIEKTLTGTPKILRSRQLQASKIWLLIKM